MSPPLGRLRSMGVGSDSSEAHGSPHGEASSFMESASYELANLPKKQNCVDIVRPVPKRTKQT